MKTPQEQIQAYEEKIRRTVGLIERDVLRLRQGQKQNINLRDLRKLAGRLNEYSSQALAYEEKIKYLRRAGA